MVGATKERPYAQHFSASSLRPSTLAAGKGNENLAAMAHDVPVANGIKVGYYVTHLSLKS